MPFTREYLTQMGVPEANLDAVMREYGKAQKTLQDSIDAANASISMKDTEITGLKDQVSKYGADMTSLQKNVADAELTAKALAELQAKYTSDTTSLQTKLDAQARAHARDLFFGGYEFANDLAKAGAMSAFDTKEFKLDGGAFLGAKEFMDKMKTDNPTAFKVSEPPPAQGQQQGQPPAWNTPNMQQRGQASMYGQQQVPGQAPPPLSPVDMPQFTRPVPPGSSQGAADAAQMFFNYPRVRNPGDTGLDTKPT